MGSCFKQIVRCQLPLTYILTVESHIESLKDTGKIHWITVGVRGAPRCSPQAWTEGSQGEVLSDLAKSRGPHLFHGFCSTCIYEHQHADAQHVQRADAQHVPCLVCLYRHVQSVFMIVMFLGIPALSVTEWNSWCMWMQNNPVDNAWLMLILSMMWYSAVCRAYIGQKIPQSKPIPICVLNMVPHSIQQYPQIEDWMTIANSPF